MRCSRPMLTLRTGQARPNAPGLALSPRIFAVAAINGVIGAAVAVLIFPIAWAADSDRNLAAAQALAAGTFGQDHTYLYSPLAAALTLPVAAIVPYGLATAGWLIGRLGILAAGVARETRELSTPDRILVLIAAIGFVPTLYDLLLGNLSILITAVVAVIAWSEDGYLTGLPMGLLLATVPKPALIPVLLWMALYRRRSFLSAIGSAAVLTGIGLLVLGGASYAAWLQVLLHPYYLGTQQLGNMALGAMLPPILAWPLTVLTIVATVVALRRGETPGLIACLCAGLLIAPYTMAYGAVLLLVVVRPLARVAPKPTFILAALGFPGRHHLPAIVGGRNSRHDAGRSGGGLDQHAPRSHCVSRRWPILAIFILSGAAGLIYEVVWARQLVLVFGNTTQAVSAILTGFFGGIAIGSVVGGRIADRVRRPLRMYGLLELILVVVVILTPVTFRLLHNVYAGAFTGLEDNPTLLALIRFGLSLLALGPATILMGATLPTLTRYLSRDPANLEHILRPALCRQHVRGDPGDDRRRLHPDRAAGPDWHAPRRRGLLGDRGSRRARSSMLAGARCRKPRRAELTPSPSRSRIAPAAPAAAAVRPRLRLALLVAYISGLTSLGYQVLWVRLLASGTGDSTYVFTTILAIFLIGLGLGAVAFNAFRTRIKTINLLAIGQIVIAVLVTVGMLTVIDRGSGAILSLTTNFETLFTKFAGPVAFVVLPATFVMGLTFPATSALVADSEGHVGGNSGLLLSANTLGAISGTFLIPFVVIPLVGSPIALGLIALVNLVMGAALAFGAPIEQRLPRLVTGGASVSSLWSWSSSWPRGGSSSTRTSLGSRQPAA